MTAAAASVARPTSPYKGLAPFDDSEVDALLFFGRERDREIICANLLAARLTILYGPSGVGKSSVLRAGVARDLRRLPERPAVVVHDAWADDPLPLLDAALAAEAGVEPTGSVVDTIALAAAVRGEVFLVLDQVEEYFLYHPPERRAGPLDELLPDLVGRAELAVHLLIGMREDALAQLDVFKTRIPGLFANSLRLDRLDREAGRRAIVGPVERFAELVPEEEGLTIEDELVEAVLDGVRSGEVVEGSRGRGAVRRQESPRIEAPFLQLVLERLWEAERSAGSRRLRLSTLDSLGGCQSIVHEHLARALAALDRGEKDVAANVFDHLVTPSGTKIAHRASDLAEYASVGEQELGRVLDTLGRERILRPVDGDDGGDRRYEIFHDVLADPVLAWRAERRVERERLDADRKHRRLIVVAVASLVALAITAAIAVFALTQRSQARAQRSRAEAQQAQARHEAVRAHARELDATALSGLTVDPQRALRQALRAARLSPGLQAEDVLRTSLLASRLRATLPAGGPVTTAAYSHDGRLILTASSDGKARIYDARRRRLLRTLDARSPLTGAVFNRSGSLVVTEGRDGAARVWDTRTGRQLRVLRQGGAVLSAAFSQGGGLLVTTGADRTARIWRVGSWQQLMVLPHPGPVLGAVFSNDGSLVLTRTRDRFARVFHVPSGRLMRTFDQGGTITVATFSPNGHVVLTAGANQTARTWDLGDGRLLHELKGHVGRVLDAAFGPGGRTIATGSSDGSARVWSFPSGTLVTVLIGHSNYVLGVAFSPDGNSVVTTSVDRTARVWQPSSGDLRAVLAGHTESVTGAAFDPDGSAVVTASMDGTARVWDPQVEPLLRPLARMGGPVRSVSVTPDGKRLLVVGGARGGASLRDVVTGRLVRSFGAGRTVADAVLSRDGRRIVAAVGPALVVWDAASGRELLRRPTRAPLVGVAIGRDGRMAAGDARGTVTLWSPTGGLQRTLRIPSAGATDVAFSPDGSRLATASDDKLARVWDVRTGRRELTLRGHRDAVRTARFSPDGTEIVTASRDHDARLWSASTGRSLGVLRAHFGEVSDAEFSPDGRWIVTAGPTTAGLWDARSRQRVYFLRGHESLVESAVFDPTSRRIVTGGLDGTVRAYACDVCGGLRDLVSLAARRLRQSG